MSNACHETRAAMPINISIPEWAKSTFSVLALTVHVAEQATIPIFARGFCSSVGLSFSVWMAHNAQRMRSVAASATERGFTLIELLVVLVIMGLFVGLVSAITRPDDRALLRLETDRLAQLLDLAATESRLTGKSIAWTADESGYRFWRFNQETDWSEILDDDSLRARTLPHGMKITSLRVENTLVQEKRRLEFNPYGTTLSFRIETSLGDAHCAVEGSPIGEVRAVPEALKKNGEIPLP